jgi:hypothetical protein
MGLSRFAKRFDQRKQYGPSASEAGKKEAQADREGEKGDQAEEEACWLARAKPWR